MVLNNTASQVIAVDTSINWVKTVDSENKVNNGRLNLFHADLGTVVDCGYPSSYEYQYKFFIYTDYIWQQKEKPDVVLVDGRFRVCCFLTSVKYASTGTKIIFDDYINRPYYHIVEKYVSRVKVCGRQCLFIVPAKDSINIDELNKDIMAFRNVMD